MGHKGYNQVFVTSKNGISCHYSEVPIGKGKVEWATFQTTSGRTTPFFAESKSVVKDVYGEWSNQWPKIPIVSDAKQREDQNYRNLFGDLSDRNLFNDHMQVVDFSKHYAIKDVYAKYIVFAHNSTKGLYRNFGINSGLPDDKGEWIWDFNVNGKVAINKALVNILISAFRAIFLKCMEINYYIWSIQTLCYRTSSVSKVQKPYFKELQSGLPVPISELSNHSLGLAIDINPATNWDRDTIWDMPVEIVKIFREHGFWWGGEYDSRYDTMHFEYKLPYILKTGPAVCFPVATSQSFEPPLKYYRKNETGDGGFYPAGLHQNLHGGIHFKADDSSPDKLVRASLPGYIVAVRFFNEKNEGNNAVLDEFIGNKSLGFVLLKHEIGVVSDGKPDQNQEAINIYSLYMHLDSPNYDLKEDVYVKEVKWFKKLMEFRYGAVVDLDHSSSTLGKTLPATKMVEENATSFSVQCGVLQATKDGKVTAIGKKVPEDVQEAIEGFVKGAVVTFSSPLLSVDTGEVIGKASQVLHWEIFATSEQGAIKKLCELDKEFQGKVFLRITETKSDNFFSMPDKDDSTNEFGEMLLDNLPEADDKDALTQVFKAPSNSNIPTYGDALKKFFKETDTFAGSEPDQAKTKEPFTYPIKLKFKNPFGYNVVDNPVQVTCTFSSNGKTVGKQSGKFEIKDFNADYSIYVPADADTLHLSSDNLCFATVPISDLKVDEQNVNTAIDLFKDMIKYRWRNVVLEHLNEWTVEGMEALIDTLDAKHKLEKFAEKARNLRDHALCKSLSKNADVVEVIKKLLRPLTWWGRVYSENDDPYGEMPVIGSEKDEKSIFGSMLPKDAKIDNMHPVTFLWLVSLLLERGKIQLNNNWTLASLLRSEGQKAQATGWVCKTKDVVIGSELYSYLVNRGYGSGEDVVFEYQSSKSVSIKFKTQESLGVAFYCSRVSFWGEWTLSVELNGAAVDSDLMPESLSVPEPQFSGVFTIAPPKKNSSTYAFSFNCATECPKEIQVFVGAKYWVTDVKMTPDKQTAGTDAPYLFFANAKKNTGNVKKSPKGFNMDGPFYVWTDGAYKFSLEKDFSYAEFTKSSKGEMIFETKLSKPKDPKDFRLHQQLSAKLQEIRDNAKNPKKPNDKDDPKNIKIKILKVSNDGLTISIKPYKAESYSDLKTLVVNHCSSDGFSYTEASSQDSLSITLAYSEKGGELSCEIDSKQFLSSLIDIIKPPQEKIVHISPVIYIPNGGHFLFDRQERQLFLNCTIDELKNKCSNDLFQLTSDFMFPPVSMFTTGDIDITMSGSIDTSIKVLGNESVWKAAKPLIKLEYQGGKTVTYGTLKNGILSEPWTLTKDRMKKSLKFSLVIGNPSVLPNSAPVVEKTFDATPAFLLFDMEKEEDGLLYIKGTAHCMPTTVPLEIICEKNVMGTWVQDKEMERTVKYRNKANKCSNIGEFFATVSLIKVSDPDLERKFTWQVTKNQKVLVEPVKPKSFTYKIDKKG